jgi:hypothetical protein
MESMKNPYMEDFSYANLACGSKFAGIGKAR